ncbi:MAG: hypothetical protein NC417_12655 [Candidatus Gastranaerophilales bacterium]|nr:hypothetical protein [Candidatus Gastranaerophilales bacterium]
MNKKATGIVSYIYFIGWLIAYFAGDKEGAKFHLNQSLVLWICNIALSVINIIAGFLPAIIALVISAVVGICSIFIFVCWILGLVHACKEEKELPLIGKIQILK